MVRKTTSFSIEEKLWAAIRKLAIDRQCDASDLIEEAIEYYLKEPKK